MNTYLWHGIALETWPSLAWAIREIQVGLSLDTFCADLEAISSARSIDARQTLLQCIHDRYRDPKRTFKGRQIAQANGLLGGWLALALIDRLVLVAGGNDERIKYFVESATAGFFTGYFSIDMSYAALSDNNLGHFGLAIYSSTHVWTQQSEFYRGWYFDRTIAHARVCIGDELDEDAVCAQAILTFPAIDR